MWFSSTETSISLTDCDAQKIRIVRRNLLPSSLSSDTDFDLYNEINKKSYENCICVLLQQIAKLVEKNKQTGCCPDPQNKSDMISICNIIVMLESYNIPNHYICGMWA